MKFSRAAIMKDYLTNSFRNQFAMDWSSALPTMSSAALTKEHASRNYTFPNNLKLDHYEIMRELPQKQLSLLYTSNLEA